LISDKNVERKITVLLLRHHAQATLCELKV